MTDTRQFERNPIFAILVKPYGQLMSYMVTRRLVIQHQAPIDMEQRELSEKGIMGAWSFNIYEIFLASIPATLLYWYIKTFVDYPLSQTYVNPYTNLSELESQINSIINTLQPFTVPFALTIVGFLLSWASLHREDISKESLRKARHLYLYLDGSYGLFSQSIMILGLGILTWEFNSSNLLKDYIWWGVLLIWIGVFHAIYLASRKIPKKLFVMNGYSDDVKPMLWKSKSNVKYGPWVKWSLSYILTGYPLSLILGLILYGISYLIALFLVTIN